MPEVLSQCNRRSRATTTRAGPTVGDAADYLHVEELSHLIPMLDRLEARFTSQVD